MIRKIRGKFIRIALAALAVAMILVTVIVNVANWYFAQQEMLETMSLITRNDGRYPVSDSAERGGKGFGGRFSRESSFETRYFSVAYQSSSEYQAIDMTHIASVTESEALELARQVIESGRDYGYLGNYMFLAKAKSDLTIITVLDCETKLNALRSLAAISGVTCLLGILLATLFVALFSRKAIQPLIESAEKQKRFITDAGHELKTPLAVISANMDILSQDLGSNEWVVSTQKQVGTLRSLVNEMVYLSRLDEEEQMVPQKFDLSAAVLDAAAPFVAMAEFHGTALTVDAAPGISLMGDEAAVRRLVSVLCDNAVKYSSEGDEILLTLQAEGRRAKLETRNVPAEPIPPEAMAHLFDRFYRGDPARSKEYGNGGCGIGLAVAKAIVEKHGGEMTASSTGDGKIRFVCTFPQSKAE